LECKDQFWRCKEGASIHKSLLISTAKTGQWVTDFAELRRKPLGDLFGRFLAANSINSDSIRELRLPLIPKCGVLIESPFLDYGLRVAVFRDPTDSRSKAISGIGRNNGSQELNKAPRNWRGSIERCKELALSAPIHTRNTYDFSGSKLKSRPFHCIITSSASHIEIANGQNHFAWFGNAGGWCPNGAANNKFGEPIRKIRIATIYGLVRYPFASTKNGDFIAMLNHFRQSVGYHNDGCALRYKRL
jgi:hypothetical protein